MGVYRLVIEFSVDAEENEYEDILQDAIEDGVRGVNGSCKINILERLM